VAEQYRHQSLPDRVWQFLARSGPSYPAAIAAALGVGDAAVSGALTALARQHRVVVDGREGRRKYFAAVTAPTPDEGGRSAFLLDVALSRVAYRDIEIESLVVGNTPIAGL
jgi:hypothetical protein